VSFLILSRASAGASEEPPEEGYTIDDALSGLPFTLDPPTAPTITSDVTANSGNLASHITSSGDDGKRIVVTAGTYGAMTFAASDQEIIFEDGVEMGAVNVQGDRIIFRYQTTPRDPVIGRLAFASGASDIYFEGITSASGAGGNDVEGDTTYYANSGTRVAFIGCKIDNRGYAGGYVDGYSHVLYGNCELITGGTYRPNTRFMDTPYHAVVDCRVVVSNDGTMTYRVHAPNVNVTNCYVARNQFEGWPGSINADAGSGATGELQAVWYIDNTIYTGDGGNYDTGSGATRPTALTMTGNTMYSTGSAFPSQGSLPGSTINSNTTNATTTAPAWSYQ
jgi:hypothetical protein